MAKMGMMVGNEIKARDGGEGGDLNRGLRWGSSLRMRVVSFPTDFDFDGCLIRNQFSIQDSRESKELSIANKPSIMERKWLAESLPKRYNFLLFYSFPIFVFSRLFLFVPPLLFSLTFFVFP